MSFDLNPAQLAWMSAVADSPVKRLLKVYFGQFSDEAISDWATASKVTINQIPQIYRDHAKLIESVGPIASKMMRSGLLKHNDRGAHVSFHNRAAKWMIYMDLVSAETEWDDTMVSNDIKATVGQMIYAVKFAFELFQHEPANKKLLQELYIELDTKNLTLELRDKTFPDVRFPTRLGFAIEKL